MARRKKKSEPKFDDHMAMAYSEVRAVLRYYSLSEEPYWAWMNGQTCPMTSKGELGYFWYDLNRYIHWKLRGVPPIWD